VCVCACVLLWCAQDTGLLKLVTVFTVAASPPVPPYATLGFTVGLGALAGMSAAGITVSEMNLDNRRVRTRAFPCPGAHASRTCERTQSRPLHARPLPSITPAPAVVTHALAHAASAARTHADLRTCTPHPRARNVYPPHTHTHMRACTGAYIFACIHSHVHPRTSCVVLSLCRAVAVLCCRVAAAVW
jgi:hypothetical protein